MKIVVNNQQVVHLWANKRQEQARNANDSISFQGAKLFSYSACIGMHVETETGFAYLCPDRSYSVTTSKHQSMMRSAASHIKAIYCRSLPSYSSYNYFNNAIHFRSWFNEQAVEYKNLAKELKPKIAKAKGRKASYLSQLNNLKDELQALHKWAQFHISTLEHSEEDMTALNCYALNALEEYEHEDWDKLKAQIAEENKKALERLANKHKEELAQWKAGETSYLPHGHEFTYLRMTANNDIQTSKGMTIPNMEAHLAYQAFKRGKLLGKKLLGYTITQVDTARRVVVAGCHTVPFSEIEDMGSKLVLLMSA